LDRALIEDIDLLEFFTEQGLGDPAYPSTYFKCSFPGWQVLRELSENLDTVIRLQMVKISEASKNAIDGGWLAIPECLLLIVPLVFASDSFEVIFSTVFTFLIFDVFIIKLLLPKIVD
jgi:hypothetical protein